MADALDLADVLIMLGERDITIYNQKKEIDLLHTKIEQITKQYNDLRKLKEVGKDG